MLYAVIMAGGSGTRFWPASRAALPKQLLNLAGDRTMIQATVARLGELVAPERTLVMTGQSLVSMMAQQLPQLPNDAFVGEPCKRDTAPCIGLAAGWVARSDPDATMVVMPSDHVIDTDEQFQQTVRYAARLVDEEPDRLITFGIRPTYAAESFGYIERDQPLPTTAGGPDDPPVYHVRQFHEKPPAELAQRYLESGRYFWNSGIFVWKVRTILSQLQIHEPRMYSQLAEIVAAMGTDQFEGVFSRQFAQIEGKSVDYAVLERAEHVIVVEAPFAWDDVGSWQAIARLRGTDASGNTVVGRHLGVDTSGTIVRTGGDHLVVTLGLKDCIVVHTPDATLVADKHCEESVRDVVKRMEQEGLRAYL